MKIIRSSRRYAHGAAGSLLALFVLAGNADAGEGNIKEVRQGAEQLRQTLLAMPYASEGTGPAIYTFEFSECPHCQRMHRDWKDALQGVQMRRMFYAVSPRSAAEMTALARSRDIEDYKAYMEGRRSAPPHDDRNLPRAEYSKNVAAFNSIITPIDKVVEPVLRSNGVITRNLVSPMLIWEENGKLYAAGGYGKDHFANIIQRVKAGNADSAAPASSASAASEADAPAQDGQATLKADIVGLRLGMTQAEALAALRAHNPNMRITESPLDVTINDSNRRPLKVTRYVKEVRGIWGQGSPGYQHGGEMWQEQIVAVFAPPPAAHRVQYVRRIVRYTPEKGSAFDDVVASAAQKYGKATHARKQGNSLIQLWLYDGEQLTDTQFLNWFNTSKIGIDLTQPGREGGTQVEESRHLGLNLVSYGHGVQMMGAVLAESKTTMNQRNEATRALANAALEAHEAKLRGEAKRREAPKL